MGSRFVNLLVRSYGDGPKHFSLHCMNTANLFHPSRRRPAVRGRAVHQRPSEAPLPPPSLSFDWPGKKGERAWMNFMAFGPNRENLLAVDQIGRTFMYNHASRLLRTGMPEVCSWHLMDPISIAVGDRLYVMSGRQCFKALILSYVPNTNEKDWCWYSLQPPPLSADGVEEMEHRSRWEDVPRPYEISAYTVVGDSEIWISTFGAGTYSYDTERDEWSKVGNWALPFRGRAEYIPELDLWFGFTPDDLQLCASDLIASCESRPPFLQDVWEDVKRPEDWTLTHASVVPLGSGEVCVARFFNTCPEESIEDMLGYALEKAENFAVLEGVRVLRPGGGRLRLVKHKSERYVFGHDLAIPL